MRLLWSPLGGGGGGCYLIFFLQDPCHRPWDGHTILRVRAPICGVWLHTINTPPPRRRRRIVASYDKYSSSSSSSSNRGFIRQILLLLVVVVVESLLLWTTQPLNLPEKGCHNSRYGAHFGKDWTERGEGWSGGRVDGERGRRRLLVIPLNRSGPIPN